MKIIWSPQARDDLEEIFNYLLEDNPSAALSVCERIEQQTKLLTNHPNLGRAGRVPGTRELVIANTPYIVPYRTRQNCLEIIRVYHGARKWPRSFDA
jgi:toxin ParE1/3/4